MGSEMCIRDRVAQEELEAEEECVYEWLGLVVEVLVEVELSE